VAYFIRGNDLPLKDASNHISYSTICEKAKNMVFGIRETKIQ
jgi:hypothetical protein